eukprot:gene10310-12195_t
MLFHHLADIFHRIKLVPCRVMEKRYGLTKLLNTIPLLYHLGDWTEAAPVLSNCNLVSNLIHLISREDNPNDSPPDLEEFPELAGARVDVQTLYSSHAPFLVQRPQSRLR